MPLLFADFSFSTLSVSALGDQAKGLLMQYGANVVGAIVLMLVAWIAAGWTSRFLGAAMRRARIDETLTRFMEKLARWGVLLLAVLACLSIFGVETTSFAAVIGAAGLAVGLAFQGTLSNFAAGVMLLIFRPFAVGHAVNVAGLVGKVDSIDIFTTAIDTFDNRRIIVPNSSIFGATIENISFHPRRRVDVEVGTAYEADIDRTRHVLESAVAAVDNALQDPPPEVVLNGLGASSVDWRVSVWAKADDFLAIKQATIRAVKMSLDQADIGIPYPQRDVHLKREPRKIIPRNSAGGAE
ncbi:MAG: mechanosensitive ion channel [Planctomycetales bacterium]|nr:mechanosensitive ion channel [Planctomycetales bacterium]